ncbi:Mdm33 family-domain-containing protein [Chiua virens]|nr:Mdm33 family-domain-containing protein [Chiua virens]
MLWTRDTGRIAAFSSLSRSLQGAYPTRGITSGTRTSQRNNHTPTSQDTSTDKSHTIPHALRRSTSPRPVNVETLQNRLKEWGVLASASLRHRTAHLSKHAKSTFSNLGLHLNRVTGYEEIDALKRRVVEQGSRRKLILSPNVSRPTQEAHIKAIRRAARDAKTAYDDAVLQRSVSQRQVNDLLQRKSSWTDTDVSQFTSLVRSDHALEQDESRAKARVMETEDAVDREFSELMRAILARYHEEQVWSDKIRSASTYGSLAVLGVNVVVFIVAIIVVEPWKRKKLAQTFERKVEEMGAETKALINDSAARLEGRLTRHEELLTELISQVSAEVRQGSLTASRDRGEAFAEETLAPSTSASWRTQLAFSADLGAREFMLVAGSAAAGGLIMLSMRSLFGE